MGEKEDSSNGISLVKELIDSIKLRLYNRITDPILGTFVITYFFSNIQGFLYFYFSPKDDISCLLDEVFYKYFNCKSLIVPSFLTLFYVFVWPYIQDKVLEIVEKKRIRTKDKLLNIHGRCALTADEANELQKKHYKEIDQLKKQKDSIKSDMEDLEMAIVIESVTKSQIGTNSSLMHDPPNPKSFMVIRVTENNINTGDWVNVENRLAKLINENDNPAQIGLIISSLGNRFRVVQISGEIDVVAFQLSSRLKSNLPYFMDFVGPAKKATLAEAGPIFIGVAMSERILQLRISP